MSQSAWVIAVLLPEQRLVIQMSISIEIDTFNFTTGHRRMFATKHGGDKIFNRLSQGRFRRGLMDRGGESCKGVGVAVVIKPNISLK